MYFKFAAHLKKENNNKRTTSDNKKNWQKNSPLASTYKENKATEKEENVRKLLSSIFHGKILVYFIIRICFPPGYIYAIFYSQVLFSALSLFHSDNSETN